MTFAELPSVTREVHYDSSLSQITGTFARMHELDEAIEWTLIRAVLKTPERFVRLDGGGYVWRLEGISKQFPSVVVVFAFDPDKKVLNLIDIRIPS